MSDTSNSPFGIDYWASESVQERADQRMLMRRHILRTQMRFGLFVAGLVAVSLSSLFLEYVRSSTGEVSFSIWLWLGGMMPALLGLVAILRVAGTFVREVYDFPSPRPALEYAWLLLFGRAPLALLDLLQWGLEGLFARLGWSLPPIPVFAPYPSLVVQEGQIGEKDEDKPMARLGGPGNVVMFNDSAVVLERFGRFVRVAGPGAVFLRRFERIREALDLRPQERSEVAQALTKDGIPVQAEVQVRFQLFRPPANASPPKTGIPRRIHQQAWTRAGQCHTRVINTDTGVQRDYHWPERVMGNVGSSMRAIIASYWLDELLEPREPTRDPRPEISERLHHELDTAARNFGAQVLEVRLGALEPMLEEVKQERIASWQVVRKSRARREEAMGWAAVIRERGLAHAHAQMEIFRALTQGVQDAINSGVPVSPEFVAMRFIGALRQVWTRPGLAPVDALHTLNYLQHLIKDFGQGEK